jgi:hypothetical protein
MTAVVGILCKDGVVIGTDSATTFMAGEVRTVEQSIEKLYICQNKIIVAGSGSVGHAQRFNENVDKAWHNKLFVHSAARTPMDVARELSAAQVADFGKTGAIQGTYGALVAFPHRDGPQLCEFNIKDFQPEMKNPGMWFCSMGSTQPMTDSFLCLMRQIFWTDGPPNLSDGMFAATWTLDHAIRYNPGGVNSPVRMAVLQNDVVRGVPEDELQEHRQSIHAACERLRDYRKELHKADAPTLPKPPSRMGC